MRRVVVNLLTAPIALEPFITVATFTYPHEAAILKGRLESEGIECFLRDELTVQVYNFYSNAIGGVKLQVRRSDASLVYRILDDIGMNGLVENAPTNGFMEKFDRATRRLPLLNNVFPALRLVLVVTGFVLFLLLFVYYAVFPKIDFQSPPQTEITWPQRLPSKNLLK